MEGQKFSQNLLTSRPLGPNCLKSRFSPAPPSLPLSSAALRLLTSLLPAVFPPQGRPRCLPPAPGTALPLTGPLPAGSLEPRVEVLINRINEVQQAKKKASEELGEARAVWEALQREMDSLTGEKVRLKEILNKKQETLRILRLHCQEKESEAQRKQSMLQECKERISALNSQIEEEKNKQRQLRLDFEEQLEDLMGQHKDLWKLHRPEQMAQEIGTLDSSKEQLLKEEKLVEAKLEDVKHRLCSQFGADGCSAIAEGLFLRSQEAAAAVHLFEEENRKAQELLEASARHHEQLQQKCRQLQQRRQRLKEELEKLGMQIPARGQSKQEEGAGPGEPANPKLLGAIEEKDPELPTKQGPVPS